ncbi:MAG: hypothetical protein AB1805_00875 [Nitrospirota bacterium]
MKKIFVPISERDYLSTDRRFFYLLKRLSAHFIIEFATISKEVFDDVNKRIQGAANIKITLLESKNLPLTLDFRTNLVKAFVQYTYDIAIPRTDLKLWKVAAFDDFWGHVATTSFEEFPPIDADVILLPLMSYDDTPWEDMDVFYTSVAFKAKEAGIKVIGFQLYPVFQGLKLMPLLMDALVVRKEYERQYYIDRGIDQERIYLLTEKRDIYSISPIDDMYKNHIYNDQIDIGRDELAVVVYNHTRYRPLVKQIIATIGSAHFPIVLSLIKRDYQVRDLNESTVIQDFYLDEAQSAGCRFYVVDAGSTVPIVMISDVILSPTYIAPVEFAARYGKRALVYNPFYDAFPDVEGTTFINNPRDLLAELKKAYDEKARAVEMSDVIHAVFGKTS